MDRLTRALRQIDLLGEAVDATLATLTAIHGADLFAGNPPVPEQAALQANGLSLLAMLESHVLTLRSRADALGVDGEDC